MKGRFLWLVPCVFILLVIARGAQHIINVGSTANDTTGDTLRVAFQKINSNFTEVYVTTFTNGTFAAGNGLVKDGTNLHFGTSSPYTDFLIPFATGTNTIGFNLGLSWDNDNDRFLIGTGNGSRFNFESATPLMYMYAGGNPATDFSRLTMDWDSSNLRYRLVAQRSGASNAVPLFVGVGTIGIVVNTDGTVSLSAQTNKLSIAGGQLLLDGVPIASSTENNITLNSYISNLFYISGKGNTLVITQALTIQALKTNLVATTSTGLLTNANYGSGISWDPSTLTISSTGGGGSGVSTAVTALGLSGTNVTGFDCSTNNMSYTLTLAGHYLFGTSTFSNLPQKTTNMFFTLGVQQDSTGGWVPKFTNSIVAVSEGSSGGTLLVDTNANAVSYIYFHTSLFTNSMLVGSLNAKIQ